MSTEAQAQAQESQWRPIGEAVGAGDVPVEVIESLCLECHEQGETRMLLTVIPYFREVIVVSFRCDHCGHTNNEVQSAGEIQQLGAVYTLKCTDRTDLDRQLVKSEHCTISIPEYQLTIPAGRGQFTTVEGVLADTVRDLEHDQPLRKIQHPELHDKIADLCHKLRAIVPNPDDQEDGEKEGEQAPTAPMPTFTLKLDDPSGNSFVETRGGLQDPKWSKREYGRDRAQDEQLGLQHDEAQDKATSHYAEEVLSFPGVCSLCGSELETLMKKVTIPHFKVSEPPTCSLAHIRLQLRVSPLRPPGHHPHVDQLPRLRLPRQRGQVGRRDRRQGQAPHPQGRRLGRPQSRHPQGAFPPPL